MKRIIILLSLFGLLPAGLHAEAVGLEQARQKAMQVLGTSQAMAVDGLTTATRAGDVEPAYYLFTAPQGGYAIITGEDSFPDVVAYSLRGKLVEGRQLPPAMQWLLDLYAQCVEAVRTGEADAPEKLPATRASVPVVEPLVPTSWGQDAPYNLLCPDGCPSGCVATATTQIMYFHRWPEQGTGQVMTYYNSQPLMENLDEHRYDWDAMRLTTDDYQGNEAARQAVARLTYDVGLAVKMEYSRIGSGSTDSRTVRALYTNFGYRASTLRALDRECYTADEWMQMISNELVSRRPLYYGGVSPEGGGKDAAGHAFVLDGTDVRGLVHINWGWDGYCDGYFDIALLNPSKYAFTANQGMVIGIQPARDGETGTYTPRLTQLTALESRYTQTSYGKTGSGSFEVDLPSLYNPSDYTYDGYATLALFKGDGTLVKQDIKSGKAYIAIQLDYGYYVKDKAYAVTCKLPAGLADGEYVIRVVTREKQSTEWALPEVRGGWKNNYIRAVVAGGKVTFDAQEATGIQAPEAASPAASPLIYTLDGHPAGYSLDDLKRGIYVKDGKKVMKQ